MTRVPDIDRILAPWRQVVDRADAFFRGVAAGHADSMRCAPGCAGCCQQDLSILLVESVAILALLEAAPDRSVPAPGGDGCALLVDGRCAAYEARPVICRTHGLPIAEAGVPGEEPALSCCELNFTERTPPPAAILNSELLTASLVVADALARKALGIDQPFRVSVARLVSMGWQALPRLCPH